MELEQAQDAVMEMSKQLVALGLVARTWGNVSCRVGRGHFLITPSGKPYEQLQKEHLVLVDLEDLSYPKGIKPSSEKKLHREVYTLKREVGCVIHTHQEMASLAGLLGEDIPVSKQRQPLLGETIAAATYGLPGTKTLVKHVSHSITSNKVTTVLLANHGALCFGIDATTTIDIARQLELECRAHLVKVAPQFSAEGNEEARTLAVVLAMHETSAEQERELEQGLEHIPKRAAKIASLLATGSSLQKTVLYHTSPAVLEVGRRLSQLLPYLDDFAQIAGTTITIIDTEADPPVFDKLSATDNALLIREVGALCWATPRSDAEAVALVLEKNCKAALLALDDPSIKPITWLDTRLMRFVYQKKYSKIAQEGDLKRKQM